MVDVPFSPDRALRRISTPLMLAVVVLGGIGAGTASLQQELVQLVVALAATLAVAFGGLAALLLLFRHDQRRNAQVVERFLVGLPDDMGDRDAKVLHRLDWSPLNAASESLTGAELAIGLARRGVRQSWIRLKRVRPSRHERAESATAGVRWAAGARAIARYVERQLERSRAPWRQPESVRVLGTPLEPLAIDPGDDRFQDLCELVCVEDDGGQSRRQRAERIAIAGRFGPLWAGGVLLGAAALMVTLGQVSLRGAITFVLFASVTTALAVLASLEETRALWVFPGGMALLRFGRRTQVFRRADCVIVSMGTLICVADPSRFIIRRLDSSGFAVAMAAWLATTPPPTDEQIATVFSVESKTRQWRRRRSLRQAGGILRRN
ncbi:MAG: hypothetical protein C4547_15025 [Phycisphaerales bacterium]|nr:MAG: hypothetical protein C4547_15025 [Phycisphaerales bacterium]